MNIDTPKFAAIDDYAYEVFGVGETPEAARENAREWLEPIYDVEDLVTVPCSAAAFESGLADDCTTDYGSNGNLIVITNEEERLKNLVFG